MEDPGDYEIRRTGPSRPPPPAEPPPRQEPRLVLWFTAAGLVVLATVAFFFFRREPAPPPPAEAPAPASVTAPEQPLGGDAAPIELPPLDQTDALVRQLVGALSSNPRLAAWLATKDFIRNFVVVVENVSSGRTPARFLRVLRPPGPFRVIERGERVIVDPASYERYTPLAAAAQSIDAAGAARVYTTLKPRIEDAYGELGHEESVDRAVERAIVALLQVPVLEGDVALVPKGALYAYDDPRIERLTAAQKQLARMGPRNVRVVQAKLREVAAELGIRSERLGR